MNQPIAIFLRGINVNGRKVVMADLRDTLTAAGYTGVTTVLASGNVVCIPPTAAAPDAHKPHIEAVLTARYGFMATVHLRTIPQLEALCAAAAQLTIPEASHCYALLCHDATTVTALTAAYSALPPDPHQQYVPLECDALWVVPKGQTLEAPFGKTVLGNKRYTALVTSRTSDTMKKTLQFARQLSI